MTIALMFTDTENARRDGGNAGVRGLSGSDSLRDVVRRSFDLEARVQRRVGGRHRGVTKELSQVIDGDRADRNDVSTFDR